MKNMTALLIGASLSLTLSTSHAAQPPVYGIPELDGHTGVTSEHLLAVRAVRLFASLVL